MRILQVNTFDQGGGAESVATRLQAGYVREGYTSWLLVKRKKTDCPDVFPIPETFGQSLWGRGGLALAQALDPLAGRVPGGSAMGALMRAVGRPAATLDRLRGIEDFQYPSTARLDELTPERPDIIQCHNMQGNYFNLSALVSLSRRIPVVLTLHDCWLLAGHCAHSFDCERWKTGCGQCPNLSIDPPVARDATHFNWRRKQDIFASSKLYVATPSRWLMERVEQSILMPGVVEARMIENSIHECFFEERERAETRRSLGLSDNALVLLFAANTIRENRWKDFATLRGTLERLSGQLSGRELVLLALGDEGPEEKVGETKVTYVPFQKNPGVVADYYHAADLYLHAAKAETFSLTIAEAMACGTPVIATAIGAVPERIKCLDHPAADGTVDQCGASQATGILVPAAKPAAMAEAALTLLSNPDLRRNLGANAARHARTAYRPERQTQAYLQWFEELMSAQPS